MVTSQLLGFLLDKRANAYNESMCAASYDGQVHIVRLMLDRGADNYNETMETAARRGHLNIVELMLENGADNYEIDWHVIVILGTKQPKCCETFSSSACATIAWVNVWLSEDATTLTFEDAIKRAEVFACAQAERNHSQVISAVQAPVQSGWDKLSRDLLVKNNKKSRSCHDQTATTTRCFWCGSSGHLANSLSCRAQTLQCRNCKKVGHIEKVCKVPINANTVSSVSVQTCSNDANLPLCTESADVASDVDTYNIFTSSCANPVLMMMLL